ncbi:MAG: hypothetical protein JSS56_15285 [Proteobacteria bacterium]|nr:hypothetical protein [Pseudomonadota bacterium]
MLEDVVLTRALDAVHHLNDAVPPWHDLLNAWVAVAGADTGQFMSFKGGELLEMQQVGSQAVVEREYASHYYKQDFMVEGCRGVPAGDWIDSETLLGERGKQRNEYYVDFLLKHRLSQCVCLMIEATPTHTSGISFCRSQASEKFLGRLLEDERVRRLNLAIQAAVAQRHRAGAQWLGAVESTFGDFGEAICLVDREGLVVHASSAARDALAVHAGICVLRGMLRHSNEKVQSMLLAALREVGESGQARQITVAATGDASCSLDIARADPRLRLDRRGLMLLRVRRHHRQDENSLAPLAVAFAITAAEQRVLLALLRGQTPAGYAKARGLSIHTVRKQIATVMEKTGCTRQVDLLRLAGGAG